MASHVYINLPVEDLSRSRAFFEALDFSFNDQFSDDTALAMIIGEQNSAMLLTHEKFAEFTSNAIADAHKTTEVLVCLQLDSREQVDKMVETACANGGREPRGPQDHGFMYGRSFHDPDGHIWEVITMTEGGA